MDAQSVTNRSWFRTHGGRRFGIEFAAIIVLKLVALALIWFVCFRQPRVDVRPGAMADHILTPAEAAHDR